MTRKRGSLPVSGVGKVQGSTRHGLTPSQIEGMRHRQQNRCSICLSELPMVPTVDHDHALAGLHGHGTRFGCPRCVRGLLCRDCNLMLGHARDSVETLRAAVTYLRLWAER
jgi:hypothetical protein